jgi:hypothetical protein
MSGADYIVPIVVLVLVAIVAWAVFSRRRRYPATRVPVSQANNSNREREAGGVAYVTCSYCGRPQEHDAFGKEMKRRNVRIISGPERCLNCGAAEIGKDFSTPDGLLAINMSGRVLAIYAAGDYKEDDERLKEVAREMVGMDKGHLMRTVYYRVEALAERMGDQRYRELRWTWNGIGHWQA